MKVESHQIVLGHVNPGAWNGTKRMCGRGETKATKSLCTAACRHGYRACRLTASRSMLSVRIKGPKSWINLHQESGPAKKKAPPYGGKKCFTFTFSSLFISYSHFSLPTFEDQYWVRGGSVSGVTLCDGWLDKGVDRTCPIPLLFALADEKPGTALTEMCFHPKNKTDYHDRVDGVKLWNFVYFERASTFTRLIKSRPAKHVSSPTSLQNSELMTIFFKNLTSEATRAHVRLLQPVPPLHLKDEVDILPPLCKIYHVKWFN